MFKGGIVLLPFRLTAHFAKKRARNQSETSLKGSVSGDMFRLGSGLLPGLYTFLNELTFVTNNLYIW